MLLGAIGHECLGHFAGSHCTPEFLDDGYVGVGEVQRRKSEKVGRKKVASED